MMETKNKHKINCIYEALEQSGILPNGSRLAVRLREEIFKTIYMKKNLYPNVIKMIEERKIYHQQQSLMGGINDESRLKYISLVEECKVALMVLNNFENENGGKNDASNDGKPM